jgi:hypothetical protein
MSVPYTFASATAPIPLSNLDANFNTTTVIGDQSFQLGDSVPDLTGISSLQATTTTTTDLYVDGVLTGGDTAIQGFYGNNGDDTSFAAGQGSLSKTTANNEGNVAIGYLSMFNNETGDFNVAIGYNSYRTQLASTGGDKNTAIGANTFSTSTTTASYNVLIGAESGSSVTTGNGNTIINPLTNTGSALPVFNVNSENNRISMGSTAVTNAYVKVAWTVTSDARDKTNFSSVPYGLDFVSKLEPISYQFKTSREDETPNGNVRYGFKAQDILELEGDNPVIIDNEDLESLKFNSDSLIPVLVNAIKELKAELELLKSKVES